MPRQYLTIAYGIFGLAAAIAAIVAGFLGMPDVMVVSAILAALLLVAANSDRIAKIRAGASGFEAETRAVIDEARATIEQLRLVAKIAIQASLSLVMRTGRWGGFSHDEKENIHRATSVALDQLAVPAAEQEEIFQEWHTVTRFDYSHLLLGRHTIPTQVQANTDLHAEWSALREGGFANVPSPDSIEHFLRKAGMLDDEAQQLLKDYRYYQIHERHRRPEVWKALVDRNH